MKKNAELNAMQMNVLNITLIVLIVLGTLGARYIIRAQFGALQGWDPELTNDVTAELTNKIKQSGEPLVVPSSIEIAKGKMQRIYLGVSNPSANPACILLIMRCVQALGDSCGPGVPFGTIVFGPGATTPWLQLAGNRLLPARLNTSEVGIFSFDIPLSHVDPGTYMIETTMLSAPTTDAWCATVPAPRLNATGQLAPEEQLWQQQTSRQWYLNVVG